MASSASRLMPLLTSCPMTFDVIGSMASGLMAFCSITAVCWLAASLCSSEACVARFAAARRASSAMTNRARAYRHQYLFFQRIGGQQLDVKSLACPPARGDLCSTKKVRPLATMYREYKKKVLSKQQCVVKCNGDVGGSSRRRGGGTAVSKK